MDPEACVDFILRAAENRAEDAREEIEEHIEALVQWLSRGGFSPRASAADELATALEGSRPYRGAARMLKLLRRDGMQA